MSSELEQLRAGIAALEAQRAMLGDDVVDLAVVPLRAKLVRLASPQLPESSTVEQTLKQVTILFLDVVGSTTLGQQLHPEDIHAVMDGALARFTAIVEAHRGKVLQYAGDSLLAVFGAKETREDDAESAVHTGLALLAAARLQGQQVQREYGHTEFDVRVGIHTGGVLLGGGVDAEHSIRGSAVNIAARMEQSAPAGRLRISQDTYRHVRGLFDVEPQPATPVKGVDELIVTYILLRAKPRAFRVAARGIEGVETRMVGRDVEFQKLQDAFNRLRDQGRLSVVTVVAEAGVGKSRLLDEFSRWAEARAESLLVLQGRALPSTQSQPYGLLRDIVARWLRIADSDSMAVAKAKVEQGITPLFAGDDGADLAQAHAHLLGHMIGLEFAESKHIEGIRDDAKQIRSRAFHAAAQMFRRVAAQRGAPILLLLDDLHWADDGSLDFLRYLGEVDRDVPMLVVALTRPALFERRSDWGGAEGIHHRIDLRPLDSDASRLLTRELLKKLPEVPPALYELIAGSAEGNPFYMEELIKMLVDEGTIKIDPDHWSVVTDKLMSARVPQTLTGVLQARLDSLQPAEKLAMQQASVIGVVFWDQALAAIDAKATEALPGVTRRELVIPHRDTSLEGVHEFAFKHQILHHVTYDTVLKRLRLGYHAKVAEWLAALTGARANDFLGVTAGHFEKAGDHQRACEYFTRAAEYAAARFAHEATLSYVAQALALLGEDSRSGFGEIPDKLRLRWRLLEVRLRTLRLQGRRAEQQTDVAALQSLADEMNDDWRRGEAALRRSEFGLRVADYATMRSAAQQAMALAERTGDDVQRLEAQALLAGSLNRLGDPVAGKALAQDGLAATRSRGLRDVEVRFLKALGGITEGQGDVMGTLEIDQRTLLIYRETGNRWGEAVALGFLGSSWLNLGASGQARSHLEESLRLTRAMGDRADESYPLNMLSLVALREGDPVQALAHARAALEIAASLHDREAETESLVRLGEAELALRHHAAAAEAFERAYAVASAAQSVNRFDASAGLARVALASGDVAGARRALEGLLAYLAGGGPLKGSSAQRIRLTCHQVLATTGASLAAELLSAAQTELRERAATIDDAALRQSFLNNIPEHREIVAAWAARQAASAERR
jgi:class 3 adenylate cyclase/tetratricopeptide (TPR) repeat protein